MKIRDMLYVLMQKHINPEMKWHMFEVTFNAVAGGGAVNLGLLNSFAPSGYKFVGGILPFVLPETDTTIFNNAPEYMIYDGKLYIKTYKAANNVKLQIYGVVARA